MKKAITPLKLGSVWTSNAALYDQAGMLIGYCLDTPNAIAKAMMEVPLVALAESPSLGKRYTMIEMSDRMKPWNLATSEFRPI